LKSKTNPNQKYCLTIASLVARPVSSFWQNAGGWTTCLPVALYI